MTETVRERETDKRRGSEREKESWRGKKDDLFCLINSLWACLLSPACHAHLCWPPSLCLSRCLRSHLLKPTLCVELWLRLVFETNKQCCTSWTAALLLDTRCHTMPLSFTLLVFALGNSESQLYLFVFLSLEHHPRCSCTFYHLDANSDHYYPVLYTDTHLEPGKLRIDLLNGYHVS